MRTRLARGGNTRRAEPDCAPCLLPDLCPEERFHETFAFRSSTGLRLAAYKSSPPKGTPARAVAVVFPGLNECVERNAHWANHLAARGVVVYGIDYPVRHGRLHMPIRPLTLPLASLPGQNAEQGFGCSDGLRGMVSSFALLLNEVARFTRHAHDNHPDVRVP